MTCAVPTTEFNAKAGKVRPDEFSKTSIDINGASQNVQWTFNSLDIPGVNIPANIKILYNIDGKDHTAVYEPSEPVSSRPAFDGLTPQKYYFRPVSVDGQQFDYTKTLNHVSNCQPSTMPVEEGRTLFKDAAMVLQKLSASNVFKEEKVSVVSMENPAAQPGMGARVSGTPPSPALVSTNALTFGLELKKTIGHSPWHEKLVAGNWKMNGTLAQASALASSISSNPNVDICLCPPFLHLPTVKQNLKTGIALGAQDCSRFKNGAYTADTSAEMLKDIGARYVILGHSERRQFFGAIDAIVNEQAVRAHEEGLITIICVGETEAERMAGQAETIVKTQLMASLPSSATAENTVVAYEPVWAIGTGKTATPDDVKSMHAFIRESLKEKLDNSASIRILYGGSVKPDNACELLHIDNVDGALVGGASLKTDQFKAIIEAAAE